MSAVRPLVGWYLHDHGAGHRTRFAAIRPHLDADVVVFSSAAPPPVLPDFTTYTRLDRDDRPERTADGTRLDPADADPTAGGALHWAPLGHSGHAARFGAIAAALTARRFDAFVIDVSVEVSLLVRLFGVSTVLVTQPGERDDRPHRLAFDAATRILAPWPGELYVPAALAPFAAKTHFVGGISRFDGRRAADEAEPERTPGSVLVLGSGGGGAVTSHDVEAAAVATAGTARWHALGLPPSAHVTASDWSNDPFDALTSAEVVVSFAGQNAVADLAAAGARAVVVAQPRPFGEQEATARTLHSSGLALGLPAWPAPAAWPDLLARARATTPDWSRWNVASAASRAAAVIAEVASAGPAAAGSRAPSGGAAPGPAKADPATIAAAAEAHMNSLAVVTLFSAARLEHALNQFALLADAEPQPLIVGVWLDAERPPAITGVTIIHVPPTAAGLRLAAGRNAGAAEAGRLLASPPPFPPNATAGAAAPVRPDTPASAAAPTSALVDAPVTTPEPVLVFLDADCLPGPELLKRYRETAAEHPRAVLCGPVTYLPEHSAPRTRHEFAAATSAHPARPDLPAGTSRPADVASDEYRLFWSLSFACTVGAWQQSGGFDEAYEGYGAEDTDFARRLQRSGVELRWVGGAHAYHQHHPTSSPPWQHLDDILRNGALYNDRWGHWPMEGWFTAFEQAGAVEWMTGGWRRTDASLLADHPADPPAGQETRTSA